MENKTFTGFMANELHTNDELATAFNGGFYNGYTTMDFNNLDKEVKGANALLHENLQALLKHENDLKEGKQVNVYMEWQLTKDKQSYNNVKVVRTEVTEREE
ncbi:hypothetical protein NUG13_12450 [Bacillus subtilis]|uniref:Uncharacterized protein n=1 Tax=Bacillus phage vB_BsuS_PJN02 TaxID=2920374 RepID=A0AC61TS96_9CAUD|nr:MULTISPECIES: hypothetical protein [Bacillus subtilis group]YP_010681838.1 hypothetical protein PQE76_gp220 [Bacillus phage vB_BsuS_PJN02]MCR4362141.1 hypothetical protein [Bacillus subtilis]UNH58563.1 hypothetical protein [Bacillus phage vB_BsuS_PJN02]UQB84257.1 hypothetical protein KMZ31_20300 [Bacillus amyloliquefaciens]WOF32882.1 hypothetical protein OEJ84_23575 [Bacillus subtilis]